MILIEDIFIVIYKNLSNLSLSLSNYKIHLLIILSFLSSLILLSFKYLCKKLIFYIMIFLRKK